MILNFNKLQIQQVNTFTKDYWIKLCNGKKALLYIVLLEGPGESFIKVGITCSTLDNRFSTIPYKYSLLYAEYGSPIKIYNAETRLHALLRENKLAYCPLISFSGYTECYTIKAVKELNTKLKISIDI